MHIDLYIYIYTYIYIHNMYTVVIRSLNSESDSEFVADRLDRGEVDNL